MEPTWIPGTTAAAFLAGQPLPCFQPLMLWPISGLTDTCDQALQGGGSTSPSVLDLYSTPGYYLTLAYADLF
jgi:hypothetical protein